MEKLCSNCGSVVPEGTAFCTNCGTPADKENSVSKPEAVQEVKAEKTPISENVFHKEKPIVKPLHTVAYFFLMLLFAIPIVGLIASIAMSASAKNENLAHYAKAVFIWKIIAIIACIIFAVFIMVLFHRAGITFDAINDMLNDTFKSVA